MKFLRNYKFFRVLFRIICFPDQYCSWTPYAIYKIIKIIKKRRITHLFVMVPPQNNLILGYLLKQFTKVRIIFYLADLWTKNPYLNLKKRYYYLIAEFYEKKIFRLANCLLVASNGYIRLLKDMGIQLDKLIFIPFGFEEDSFNDIRPLKYNKFTIVHAGTLYPGKYVNPIHLFKAIELIKNERRDLIDKIEVILCGKIPKYVEKMVNNMELNNQIKLLGYLSNKRANQIMMSSNLNLILLYPKKDNEIIIPSKIYDYMRANRPILGLVPPSGTCANFIINNKLGTVINPNKITQIKDFLIKNLELFSKFKKEDNIRFNNIKEFERKYITKRIVWLINRI
ncbi:MAG: glycosyltransferase [Candidatus Helarchaeota archaeon]